MGLRALLRQLFKARASEGGIVMTQIERRRFLIGRLIRENPEYSGLGIPEDAIQQRRLLRSLMNLRMPKAIDSEFLEVQDAYLRRVTEEKGITNLEDLTPTKDGLYLWQGDITTLHCGAIVNAANSGMTGCYLPCHACIDNCIHTYAGVQLRLACAELMGKQGHSEPAGTAKLTPAFNLPCQYVLHTVGPIVQGAVTEEDQRLLASCYRACLDLAEEHRITSVAFCCISTGEFHFPNQLAAEIAVQTVRAFLAQKKSGMNVIFNVFKDLDYQSYRELLG